MEKKLYKSKKDEKICGVCAGLAKYFSIDVTIIRIAWLIAILCAGTGLLAYFICAIVMPEEPSDIIDV